MRMFRKNLLLTAIFLLLACPSWTLGKPSLKQPPSVSRSQQERQDVRPAIRKAGIKLQREISLSIISVKKLGGQAQKLRQVIPPANSFLFQVNFLLTKSTQKQSALLDQLKVVQSTVKSGLQNISQAPAPCTGAQLPQLIAAQDGVDQLREALFRVLDVSRFADKIKADADRAAVPILSQLKNARDQKGLDALDRFMSQLEHDLPSVRDRLLQSGPNGELPGFLEKLEYLYSNKYCNGEKGGVNNQEINQGQNKSVDPLARTAQDMTGVGQDFAAAVDQMGKDVGKPVLKLHKQIDRSLRQIDGSLTQAQIQPATGPQSCWFFFCKEGGELEYKPKDGVLFAGGQEPLLSTKEIEQGSIGDCYFLASMGAVAQRDPQIVKNMIKKEKDGTYSATFYRPRKFWEFRSPELVPEVVRIDDRLPVDYGAKADQSNLYPALLEKAYAKWKGSYAAIQGGSIGEAMQEITGVKSNKVSAAQISIRQLAFLSGKGAAIVVSTQRNTDSRILDPLYNNLEGEGGQTLLATAKSGHAYWVENIDPVKGTVLLRNPWGWGEARVLLTEAQFRDSLSSVYYVDPT